MSITQVHEALGSFELKLKGNIPREVLDAVEYFGHIAVIPGRADARTFGDGALGAARYVGVVRKKKVADDTKSDLDQNITTIGGVGMNFWLGDEDEKGAVSEVENDFISTGFATVIQTLMPSSLTVGSIGGVSGSYSGHHQWETPRKSIQYVCDTMSQPAVPANLLSANNSSFEATGGVSGWVGDNCNVAVTGAYSYLGTKSMRVTPTDGTTCFVHTASSAHAPQLVAGDTCTMYAWMLPTGGPVSAKLDLNFKDVGYGAVSSAPTTAWTSLPANVWTQVSRSITVPAAGGVTQGDFIMNLDPTAGTDRIYIDYVWIFKTTVATNVSFRVNNDGSLDAGLESDLFNTDPSCIIVRREASPGEDMSYKAIPGTIDLQQDMEDFATRAIILGASDGASFSTGEADIGSVSPGTNIYKDLQGHPLRITRVVSESTVAEENADTRASLALRDVILPHRALTLSTDDYDINGSFETGDYIYVYDPDAGLVDINKEVYIRGTRINPVSLQVTEVEWPVTSDYSVGYRTGEGVWYDLTDYVEFDAIGDTKVTIGDFERTLSKDFASASTRIGGTNNAVDTSTPDNPEFIPSSFLTTCYLDSTGLARAQQKIVWTTPLNTDLTSVLDGDHYELQYRLNTGHLYSQTWGAVSNLHWNQLNTWAQPVALGASEWQSIMITWGTNSCIINDLAAGTAYDLRVRAIDSSNNWSDWSPQEIITTAEDNIPPSQPAAPEVAASLIAIQVLHRLGMASGGEFNLETDLSHLEIHAEYEPGFTPGETTRLGNLLCNVSMMGAGTPAVGTFSLGNTTAVYVKVVAVDRSGNRSSPSIAAEVTAALIDDEHISNLTVSKITAGTITADWVLSGSIRTADDGQRIEINQIGIQAYNVDGDLVTNISSDPTSSGQFISLMDTTGAAVAGINSAGVGSFQTVNANTIFVAGQNLMDDLIDPRPKGIRAWGQFPQSSTYNLTAASNAEVGYMEISFIAEQDRMYRVTMFGEVESANGADSQQLAYTLRDGGGEYPTLSSTLIANQYFRGGFANGVNHSQGFNFMQEFTPGLHRLLWGIKCNNPAAGDMTIFGTAGPSQFYVEDMGSIEVFDNLAILNDGSTPPTAPIPNPTGTFTKTYSATWSRMYNSGGSPYPEGDDYSVYQGYYFVDGVSSSNYKTLLGFPYSTIQSNLSGATIQKVELIFTVGSTPLDTGFTAIIGTHNSSTVRPSSYPGGVTPDRQREAGCLASTTKTVVLSNTIGTEFQAGTSKGIMFGPGLTTESIYKATLAGPGFGENVHLRFTYTSS